MTYTIEGNRVRFGTGKDVAFDVPIKEAAVAGETLVVVLEIPPDITMMNNVLGMSEDGEIRWQIEHDETMGGRHPTNVYVGITGTEAGVVWLYHWGGDRVEVDARSGRIISRQFVR